MLHLWDIVDNHLCERRKDALSITECFTVFAKEDFNEYNPNLRLAILFVIFLLLNRRSGRIVLAAFSFKVLAMGVGFTICGVSLKIGHDLISQYL